MEMELRIPRHLIDTMSVQWTDETHGANASERGKQRNWALQARLKVNPQNWGPRELMRHELTWNEAEGTMTEVLLILLLDFMIVHIKVPLCLQDSVLKILYRMVKSYRHKTP